MSMEGVPISRTDGRAADADQRGPLADFDVPARHPGPAGDLEAHRSRRPADRERERRPVARAVRDALTGRRVLAYSLLVLTSAAAFLLSPAPRSKYCGEYFRINRLMGFSMNCDAAEFSSFAAAPSLLLEPGAARQNRPLYIVMGTMAGYPIRGFLGLLGQEWASAEVPRLAKGARQRPLVEGDTPFYVGFVLLNFLVLLGGVLLFDRILTEAGVGEALIYLLSLVLVSNDVVKAFFWTPHQQMFSVFAPLFVIYVGTRVLRSPVSPLWLAGVALAGGVLVLAYGTFVLALPGLLLAMGVSAIRAGEPLPVRAGLLVTLLFVLPGALWVAVVRTTAGSFYNLEAVEYGQFTWLVRASARDGRDFLPTLWEFTQTYAGKLVRNVGVFVVVAGGLLAFNALVGRRLPSVAAAASTQASAVAGSVLLGFLLFLWLMGFYRDRLMFTVVPALLCLIAIELQRAIDRGALSRRIVHSATGLAVGCWMLFTILKRGPFS
jgi:hypothetical protein